MAMYTELIDNITLKVLQNVGIKADNNVIHDKTRILVTDSINKFMEDVEKGFVEEMTEQILKHKFWTEFKTNDPIPFKKKET